MLDQRLIVGLRKNENVPHMQLYSDLSQLFRQLANTKCHVRDLLLGEEARVLGLLSMAVWIFIYAALLSESFIGRIVI
jgi:hypothetical protein